MSTPLETFELFGQLPYELRRLVWDYSLDNFPARLFQISRTNRLPCWAHPVSPPTVQACHESRAAAVSYHAACGRRGGSWRDVDVRALSATGWFHPEKDVLYFKTWQVPVPPGGGSSSNPEHVLARLGSEYRNYQLSSVRNVAFHHRVLSNTRNTTQILQQFYCLLPSVETVYWLVPQRFSEVGDMMAQKGANYNGGDGRLPASLVEIPDSYARLSYVEQRSSNGRFPMHTTWWMVREQLAKEMRAMAESGRIPREPEVLGVFLVMPESPGKHGTFREYDQARNDLEGGR
ncbi:hypothetical protein F4820DRAFT_240454 [Hypoxylon rubiginosum]|uniref:Uncharacterized protein n=1 Tax=Hypoxylon rubiginosum TaxID=110542 RepID=A0ACB9Z5E8_9PEZI|nr:hypothetical protein F4820DRAFT_240454 [Hypoxylon rubiginosum]